MKFDTKKSCQTVDICMVSDNDYVMPTCVAIQSLLMSKSEACNYHIYIIASNVSNEGEKQFKSLSTDMAKIFIVHEDAEKRFEGFHHFDNDSICVASISALLKFIIPDLLPHLDKVLYLDGDLIARESLDSLFNKNIDEFYAAAVYDSGIMYYKHAYSQRVEAYFNSGVMLLNLKKIREDGIIEKLLKTKYELNDSMLMDQNVFNLVFDGHVKLLPIRYNFLAANLYRAEEKWKIEDVNQLFKTNYRNKKQLFADAAIIHYSSKDKPWKNLDGVCASEWLEVYLNTPIEHKLIKISPREEEVGISIIMPCYNVGNYLEHTIRSILDQTFQDFELICLDDGSTDNTLSVLREYEKHYNNICVVANSNHGQGWERNYGMRIARGKYVYYMDSDDVMGHNCLERIYSCAEINRLDMLFFEGTTFFDSPELEDRFSQYKTAYDRKEAFPLVYTGEELYIKFRKSGGTIVSPCMQLARRQFLQEYRVTFPEISMLEDNLYTFDSLRYAKRVKCIPDALYNRRIRAGSTMTENRKIEEMRCLSVIIKKMLQTITEYEKDTPMFYAIAAHIRRFLNTLNKEYCETIETDRDKTEENVEDSIKEVVGYAFYCELNGKKGVVMQENNEEYHKGVLDAQNTKTYLAGRVVLWIPKQAIMFVKSIRSYGVWMTFRNVRHKLSVLPIRISEALRR